MVRNCFEFYGLRLNNTLIIWLGFPFFNFNGSRVPAKLTFQYSRQGDEHVGSAHTGIALSPRAKGGQLRGREASFQSVHACFSPVHTVWQLQVPALDLVLLQLTQVLSFHHTPFYSLFSQKSSPKLCYEVTSLLMKVGEEIVVGCDHRREAAQISGLQSFVCPHLFPFSLLSYTHFHLLLLQLIALET